MPVPASAVIVVVAWSSTTAIAVWTLSVSDTLPMAMVVAAALLTIWMPEPPVSLIWLGTVAPAAPPPVASLIVPPCVSAM